MENKLSVALLENGDDGEESSANRPAILLVDDSLDTMRPYAIYLQYRGYVVVCANSYDTALEGFDLLSGYMVVAVIDIDLSEPGKDGLHLVRHFKSVAPNRVVSIVLSGHDLEMYKIQAFMAGALRYELKPVSPTLLHAHIDSDAVRSKFDGMHDNLTQLLNYKSFKELAVNRIATMLTRSWPKVLTLMLLDCNSFKEINDNHGHLVGDEIIKKLGDILERSIRPSDLTCRRSGDEFLVLLHDVGKDEAQAKGELVLEVAKDTRIRTPSGEEIGFSFSFGVAEVEHGGAEGSPVACYESLESEADACMMEMKTRTRSGR